MNLLTMEHIIKSYTDRILLNDIGFSISENEKIGVIGINGMGKSTLLKVAAGIEPYDSGKISMRSQVKICYLPQTPVFESGTTVLKAAVEGNIDELNQWTVEADAKAMLNQLGFTEYDEKIEHMSGGQKKRIALVNALLTSADILVLDEPTNHLDNAMSEWLEEYLIQFRGAVLMVTHDRYFLDRVVNRIVEVDNGKLYSYPGNYSEFVRLKEERQNMALATERKRKSMLRTELEWLSRGARARSTKQKAHIDRIKAMQEIQDIQEEKRVSMSSVASRMGNKTIELSDISKSYGERILIKDYNYIFLKNDRIGIIGPNGCGKTTLFRMILGSLPVSNGKIKIAGKNISDFTTKALANMIAYIPQYHSPVFAYTVLDMVIMGRASHFSAFETPKEPDQEAAFAALEKVNALPLANRKYTSLSGGQRQLVLIARAICQSAKIFIMDEPAANLDYANHQLLMEIISGLANQGYCIIMSTHSPEHPFSVGNKVLLMKSGKVMGFGSPKEIITSETLQSVYDIEMDVITTYDRYGRERTICLPVNSSAKTVHEK